MNEPAPVPEPEKKDGLEALKELEAQRRRQAQSLFHLPTRSKHLHSHNSGTQMTDKPAKEKKLRKMAKASQKANKVHANKKRRPTGSKRRK